MSQPDPRSIVRIAIALAALKHKPREQSTASYLLDLQSKFPAKTKDIEGQEWRTYALKLEKQLATLKAQRDADQQLLAKLPADASCVASTSDAPPPKKKSKKSPAKDQNGPEWSWDQSRADWSRYLSSQCPSSLSLTAAYASLKGTLDSPDADLLSYASRLTDAILRAFEAIHVFLFSTPSPSQGPQSQSALGASLQLKPEHVDSSRIALTSPFLTYVLRTAMHTLVRTAQDITRSKHQRRRLHAATLTSADPHAYVDKVLDQLLERVLLVLLHALVPLCSARLTPLLSAPLKKDKNKSRGGQSSVGKGRDKGKGTGSTTIDPQKKTDVRTDVFTLIAMSLEALDTLPPMVDSFGSNSGKGGRDTIASGIRDRLGLETIRELEALYALPSPPSMCFLPSPQPPTTPSGPPAALPAPTPTPTLTPATTLISAPSQTRSQTSTRPQPQRRQHAASESRAKLLVRLAGTRAERIRALATRDAGWFLASTLNLCVTPALPTGNHGGIESPGGTSELLREALLGRIGRLIRSVPFDEHVPNSSTDHWPSSGAPDDRVNCDTTDSKFVVDAICRNMLLAVCERAMSQLISP